MNFKQLKGKIKFVSPIAYISNIMAVILFYSVVFITALFNMPSMVDLMIPMFCVFSIAIQTYFFKVRGLQESQWVDKKWLKKQENLTPDLLQTYSCFNYAFFSVVKIIITLVVVFIPDNASTDISGYVGAIILGAFIFRKWLGSKDIIPMPSSFWAKKTGSRGSYIDTGPMGNGNNVIRYKNI